MVECSFCRFFGHFNQAVSYSFPRKPSISDDFDWAQEPQHLKSIDILKEFQSFSGNKQGLYVWIDSESSRERRLANLAIHVGIPVIFWNTI